jgi:hypothetical protein
MTSRVGMPGCPAPVFAHRTKAIVQDVPVDQRRQPRQPVAHVDDSLRSTHQRKDHAAAGGPAISRLAEGPKPVLANKGRDAVAADLSFLRCGDPRTRILFVLGACHARPASCRNGRACCAISIACSRSASAIAAMTGWFAPTSPSRLPIYSATPASRCRRAPDRWRHRNSYRPPNPLGNVAVARGVVPGR